MVDGSASSRTGPGPKERAGAARPPRAAQTKKDQKEIVVIETSMGAIEVAMFRSEAPKSVENFIQLAQKGYYNGIIFHRVIPNFMIQGGDPTGTGSGGPGYKFKDEPVRKKYTRGTMAMANAGPNTIGSQFFIMHADYGLPPNFTIFGKLTAGEEVVDAIVSAPTGAQDRPLDPVKITSVTITEA